MYIDSGTIIDFAALITALGVIGGVLVNIYSQYTKQKKIEADIKEIKEELCILTHGILNCLKIMKDKGYNGAVTDFNKEIEKHLNKKAHDMK